MDIGWMDDFIRMLKLRTSETLASSCGGGKRLAREEDETTSRLQDFWETLLVSFLYRGIFLTKHPLVPNAFSGKNNNN